MTEPVYEEPNPLAFLTLDQVAEELATSQSQIYALVRRGELWSLKMGGRGQWRVRRPDLEAYVARLYEDTERFVAENPLVESRVPKDGTSRNPLGWSSSIPNTSAPFRCVTSS